MLVFEGLGEIVIAKLRHLNNNNNKQKQWKQNEGKKTAGLGLVA